MPYHTPGSRGSSMTTRTTTRTTRATTTNDNPVVRLFRAPTTPRYFQPNGVIVPVGAELHEHQDGTIMTKHTMDGFGTPDGSVVVTTRRNGNVNTTQRIGNNASLQYVFADTGEPYGGRVVNIGGIHYSTDTGTKQGNSREVIVQRVSIPPQNNIQITTRANRPLVRTRPTPSRRTNNNQRTARRRTTPTPTRRTTSMNRNARTVNRTNTRTTTTRMTRTTRRGSY